MFDGIKCKIFIETSYVKYAMGDSSDSLKDYAYFKSAYFKNEALVIQMARIFFSYLE